MSRPLCLAAPALRAALTRPATAAKTQAVLPSRRTFTSLPTLRPSLAAPRPASTVFRSGQSSTPAGLYTPSPSSSAAATSLDAEVVDIVPRTAISASPLFGGVQIRCGPRPTLARSSRLIRKRRHGFLSRIRTRNGRNTLQRRKSKSRHVLSM